MTKRLFTILAITIFLSGIFFFFRKKETQNVLPSRDETASENTKSNNVPKPVHPDAIPTMAGKEYEGSDLKLGKVLDDNLAYTRYHITYKSEGFTISGIMNIPKGDGPFPVLILNHGYIDPEIYTNGQGLKREQDFFSRNGYAVLHTDYRNHAQSDFDPDNEIRPRSGYVEDSINAVNAVKNSDLSRLDKDNIGMLGHSMGGGVTENVMVTKPDTAKAYVLLAPINSDYEVNFNKWVRSDWSDTAKEFIDKYGSPEDNPELWHSISAKYYVDRIASPVMLHQGTSDQEVPVEWSGEFAQLLKEKGKDIIYYEYPGEGHIFMNAQNQVMQRTLEFFNDKLKNK